MVREYAGLLVASLTTLGLAGACGESDGDGTGHGGSDGNEAGAAGRRAGGRGGTSGDGGATAGRGGTSGDGGATAGGGAGRSGAGGSAGRFGPGPGGSSGEGSAGESGDAGNGGDGGTAGAAGGGRVGAAGQGGDGFAGDGGNGSGSLFQAVVGKIDDLEDGDNAIRAPYVGYWFSSNDGTGTQRPPQDLTGSVPWPPTAGGSPESPQFAACTTGYGFTGSGAEIGFYLRDLGGGRVSSLDARGVSGIKFQIKGSGYIRLAIASSPTASLRNGGTCVGAGCDYHANVPLVSTDRWQPVLVPWVAFAPGVQPLDRAKILSIQFQVYSETATGPVAAFDFCVDDIEFF